MSLILPPPFADGKLIQTQAPAAVATLDFLLGFDGTYSRLAFEGFLRPATDDVELWTRISDDAGASWEADAGDYRYSVVAVDDGGTNRYRTSPGATEIRWCTADATLAVGNAADERIQFLLMLHNPNSAALKKMLNLWGSYIASTGALVNSLGAAQVVAPAAVTGLRFMFESGNIAEGRVSQWGWK